MGLIRRYGAIPLTRVDVRGSHVMVLDLRPETGGWGKPSESRVIPPPHCYTLSVYAPSAGEPPVAEVRIWWHGREVSIVGHLTGRQGVREVMPDHLLGAANDDRYAQQLRDFLAPELAAVGPR